MTRFLTILLSVATTVAIAEPLPDLAFEDIEGESVTLSWPVEQPTVLMVADRKASDHIDPWGKKLTNEFSDQIVVQGIAKLDGVPSFARGMARKIVESKGADKILLDWENVLGPHVSHVDDEPLMVVIDPSGAVVHQESGKLSDTGWARVQATIAQLVASDDSD